MLAWWRKLRGWSRRAAIEADVREEMQTHLDMKADELGHPVVAHRQFGNRLLLMEDVRAAWGWPQLEAWLRDLRYGCRMIGRRPGFAATVVLTIALGIGATSTVFSLIDTVLIRPLPYPRPDRLVAVSEAHPSDNWAQTPVAPGRLEDWQALTARFEALAGSRTDTLVDTTDAVPERVAAAFVSPRFFTALGVAPIAGRVFNPEEERYGGPAAVVISSGFWHRRFGADAGVLGRSLTLDETTFTIVGVMPASVQHPSPATEIWVAERTAPETLEIREARFYDVVGRLKDGVTVPQAQADLAAVQRMLGERYPRTDAGWSVEVTTLKERLVGDVRLALWLLLGSVGLLLLIACANIACLLLVQLNGRSAEIATRYAMGASRAAIARQLLAEGLAYSVVGGLIGLAVSFAGLGVLRSRLPDVPRIADLAIDLRVLVFAMAVTMFVSALVSLAPMLQAFRQTLNGSAMRRGRGVIGTSQRLPRALVFAQLTLATVLLVGAGLFLRSLTALMETPLGFRAENVLALRVSASYGERPDVTVQRSQRMIDALEALPGVTAVAMSTGLPGADATWPREFQVAGERSPDGSLQFARWRIVTAGYFQTVQIPILAGETCRMRTDPEQPFEVLVNQRFADRYLSGRDPIGRTVVQGPIGDSTPRIVGVVADVKEDGPATEAAPLIYACGYLRYWPDSDLLVRAGGDPAAIASVATDALRRIEPSRPVYAVRPLAEALGATLAEGRFRTLLVGLFSVLALALAAVGLYGVMAYLVTTRTNEIGIRMALGARRRQILFEILRSGGQLTAAGAIAGLALAAVASRFAGGLLHGVGPFDAATYAAAAGTLTAVALVACLIPGRRATGIDPTRALRQG